MSKSMLLSLLSQYELLEATAQHLSTLDLLHLASTCSDVYTIVRKSEPVFERLKCVSLCDGHGLKARQEFQGLYDPGQWYDSEGKGRLAKFDEEIEVRVWNLKCDAANALPCLRCGVNVCEECRYVPRVRDDPCDRSRRRPHHDPSLQSRAVICYCTACDEDIERDLPFRLSEYCDCDQYSRWICLPCKIKEDQPEDHYYETRTKLDWDIEDPEAGMLLLDSQTLRAFWCPCGKRAPKDGNVRCTWCKRRHNLRTWKSENPRERPFFDDDPCFPQVERLQGPRDPLLYPHLGYTGPIAP